MTTLDTKLIEKYHRLGPRYFTYPSPRFWQKSEKEQSKFIKNDGGNLSVYIHIPFCESFCSYCGCNIKVTKDHSNEKKILKEIKSELLQYSNSLHGNTLGELYLGGGTPTFLSPENLKTLIGQIFDFFPKSSDFVGTIEVDPRVTTTGHLDVLKECGFSKLQIGVQDTDSKTLKSVNRFIEKDQLFRFMGEAHARFNHIGIDLIYGLPNQTLEGLAATANDLKTINADSVSVYPLAHVPWLKGQGGCETPNAIDKTILGAFLSNTLFENNYSELGMGHFSKNDGELFSLLKEGKLQKNIMGYTKAMTTATLGLGVGSISEYQGAYFQNDRVLEKYRHLLKNGKPLARSHILTPMDKEIKNAMGKIMCGNRIEFSDLKAIFNETPQDQISEIYRGFIEDKILTTVGEGYTITKLGRSFLKPLCLTLDGHL
ncbi:MAG: coproporphyrinogen dehydrogenase [Bacteriovoracaceae bacterium]|jgi:oxygen-independent coproporphyrinogen III oxidase|nr:coproporphyrinogen dehydrogenase [Bacteriovoracaceae bacterium]